MVGTIGSGFISDGVLFTKALITASVSDPGSKAGSEFVFTSYPRNNIKFPIVTIREDGIGRSTRLGLQSSSASYYFPIEVRVWARNEKEKDTISQNVVNTLQRSQFASGSQTVGFGMFGYQLSSAVNVDDPGEEGIKSKVLKFQYWLINT